MQLINNNQLISPPGLIYQRAHHIRKQINQPWSISSGIYLVTVESKVDISTLRLSIVYKASLE
jgi:hypothetical protein